MKSKEEIIRKIFELQEENEKLVKIEHRRPTSKEEAKIIGHTCVSIKLRIMLLDWVLDE